MRRYTCNCDGLTCQTCLAGQAAAGEVSCPLPQEQAHQRMLPEPREGGEREREREREREGKREICIALMFNS